MGARARWVTMGVVVAFAFGAGGVLTSSAAEPAAASSFVPVPSCRLMDTRPAPDNVGERLGALNADETVSVAVRGTNGRCVIPSGATAVSLNVTVVSPSSTSYLTVFPSDASPRPLASSMNWVARQAPTANAVTSPLSADGRLSFYNLSGTVDLVVDVVGYYVPSTSGPQGPTGPVGLQGQTGPQGPTGPAGADGADGADGDDAPRLANVVYVSSSGGDFTSVQAALDAIGTTLPVASASNPYLIRIGPGVYTNPGNVEIELENHVDLEGSGPGATILRCQCTGATVFGPGLISVEVRDLTIENIDSGDHQALLMDGDRSETELRLRNVELVHASGTGLSGLGLNLVVDDVRIQARVGVSLNFTDIQIDDTTVTAGQFGVFLSDVSGTIRNSTVTGPFSSIFAPSIGQLRVADTGLDQAINGSGVECVDLWDVDNGSTITC